MYYQRRAVVPKVTILLLIANVLCYLYELHIGIDRAAGIYGMYQGAFMQQQYLRGLFSGFMHFDILHLLSNMLCLMIYGLILERNIGAWRFLGLYAGGLVGSSVLINFAGASGIHMGASGAIWGLMTGMLVYSLKNHISPYYALRGIIINLIYSFGYGVSWQGHIGGGIGGLLIALILFRSRPVYQQSYVVHSDQPWRLSKASRFRKAKDKQKYMDRLDEYPDDGHYHP